MVSKKFLENLALYFKNLKQENLLICLFILGTGIIFGNLVGIFFVIALIIFSYRRPELALVLLFFSGILKNIEFLHNLPIDLSVLAILLLIIHSSLKIIETKSIAKLNYLDILVILQGVLVLFSVIFISSRTWLNWWDAGRFIVFNLSLYFGLFLLSVKIKEIITMIHWIIFGIAAITSSAIHNLIFGKMSTWHLSSFGESLSSLGLLIGLGIIFFFHSILCSKQISNQKIHSFVLYGLLIFILAFLPSRHILLSLCLTFLLTIFIKNLIKQRLRLLSVILFSLTLYFVGILSASALGVNVRRFWSYKGVYAVSFSTRITYIKSAVELFKENPVFGIGMGEFMRLHGGLGHHPHNLLLESLVSFGILSIFIFWPAFAISFKNSAAILKDENIKKVEIIALWFIFFFFESLFSGSLTDFRTLWLFMGILSIMYYSVIKRIK